MNNQLDQPSRGSRLSTTEWWCRFGQQTATVGFFLYSAFAPHSIAAAEISLGIAGGGWLVRTIFSRSTGFHRTRFDLPILLFFLWTAASSLLSQEPRISIAKIQSTCVIFLFYLTQAIVTRRTAVLLVAVMILSGAAGTLYSIYDLARGRGVVIESLAPDSPLRQIHLGEGDAIWRIGGQRVYSVTDIDDRIRNAPTQTEVIVSVITHGEHLERRGLTATTAIQRRPSPSGIVGGGATHRFRASGWTRHYETYSEILQILAQLAFGLALANFTNHGFNLRAKLAFVATALLALGIVLTAMRTVLVALAIGVCVISVRALGRKAKVVVLAALLVLLAIGAFAVNQTRAQNALWFEDPSSSLRARVAKVGLSRMMLHPLFGHGMDAMHVHWREWGFPGSDMLHLHSTPLQLAFDRGVPALIFWLWIMALFWLTASRGEKSGRDSSDTNRYGIMLGAIGAVAGFFASSLVNYNFGDGEVALVFWWLLGIVVVSSRSSEYKL
ncbi:MAG: O-antigen ligase family protein [Acidobacteriota bacterium]|nr:O-antigen ligase family protein [Acidobacteriota bacterium]